MLKATGEEIEKVREYFEWQAPDLEVTFMQKVSDVHYQIGERRHVEGGMFPLNFLSSDKGFGETGFGGNDGTITIASGR